MFQLVLIQIAAILTASSFAKQQPIPEQVREACESEISMLCAQDRDIAACLHRENSNLTERCAEALSGKPKPGAQAMGKPTQAHAAQKTASPSILPANGTLSVEIQPDYSGPGDKAFPALKSLLSEETSSALKDVASRLGLPQYGSGLVNHPASVRFEYDPTSQEGEGNVGFDETGSGRWIVTINLATWEDCPSKDKFRSLYRHELTHAVVLDFLFETGSQPPPQWLQEGLAVYGSGDSDFEMFLRNANARHGSGYPTDVPCPFDSAAGGPSSFAITKECYAYFTLAVKTISQAAPDGIPKLLQSMRDGDSVPDAVSRASHLDWQSYQDKTIKNTKAAIDGVSLADRFREHFWRIFDRLQCRG